MCMCVYLGTEIDVYIMALWCISAGRTSLGSGEP